MSKTNLKVLQHDTDYQKNISFMKDVINNLEKVEEKSRCLRVRFLDWLSDKLLDWSKATKKMADNIDSPCVIKLKGVK